MEDPMLIKAVEDARLIRKVMDRSSESAVALNNAFMRWGISILIVGVITYISCIIWPSILDVMSDKPILVLIPKVLVALVVTAIFLSEKKKISGEGLNNQFLILWLAIFGYNILVPVVGILSSILGGLQSDIAGQFTPQYAWASFAVGMLCMRIFAHLKFAGWLVWFYLALFAVNLYLAGYIVVWIGFILPFSLLVFGIYLKLKIRNKPILKL